MKCPFQAHFCALRCCSAKTIVSPIETNCLGVAARCVRAQTQALPSIGRRGSRTARAAIMRTAHANSLRLRVGTPVGPATIEESQTTESLRGQNVRRWFAHLYRERADSRSLRTQPRHRHTVSGLTARRIPRNGAPCLCPIWREPLSQRAPNPTLEVESQNPTSMEALPLPSQPSLP